LASASGDRSETRAMSIPAYTAIAAADDTDAARRIVSLMTDDELKLVERYCIRLLWVCRDERWKRREGNT